MNGLFVFVLAQALRVEDFERMALEAHPAVRQAEAHVAAAAGRERQAGLYPNPVLGATSEEIAAGPVIRGGEHGGFFEQRIVTGGKLGLSKRVAAGDRAVSEALLETEKQRVRNAARLLFYQAMGDAQRVKVRGQMSALAVETVQIARELMNVGQADQPDRMAAEVEAQRAALSLTMAKNAQERTWRQMAALLGRPAMAVAELAGDLTALPALTFDAEVLEKSPELREAASGVLRAEAALARAKREPVPDVMVRGGAAYNRELLEVGMRPVGREGFFEIGVEVPLFNRNQGNVAAARAEREAARQAVERTRTGLRLRLAEAHREYANAFVAARTYRDEMIPTAEKAHAMYKENYRRMAAAYPFALQTQRNLVQLQDEYVDALVMGWQRAVEIEGLLVEGLLR